MARESLIYFCLASLGLSICLTITFEPGRIGKETIVIKLVDLNAFYTLAKKILLDKLKLNEV